MGTLAMGLTPEQKKKIKTKLDSSNNSSTVQVGKGAENNLDEVVVTGKKPKKVGQTRSQQRKDERMNKRATKRANRTAENDPSASKNNNPAQYEANLNAEKDKIKANRAGRKQFLRNFGSQLVRGVNADQISKGSVAVDPSYMESISKRNQGATGKEVPGNNVGEKSERALNQKQIETELKNKNNSVIGGDNSQMRDQLDGSATSATRTSAENTDFNDDDEEVKGGFKGMGFSKIAPTNPVNKISEDSNPSLFMRKEFMKKMGM